MKIIGTEAKKSKANFELSDCFWGSKFRLSVGFYQTVLCRQQEGALFHIFSYCWIMLLLYFISLSLRGPKAKTESQFPLISSLLCSPPMLPVQQNSDVTIYSVQCVQTTNASNVLFHLEPWLRAHFFPEQFYKLFCIRNEI
jgi:hypothetical protein